MSYWKKDDGSSELFAAIFMLPIMLAVLISIVDFGAYFVNRQSINSLARDGARSVAIFGGNGNATQSTPIEKAYGLNRDEICNGNGDVNTPVFERNLNDYKFINGAYTPDSTAIECNIMRGIIQTSGIHLEVTSVKCSPETTPNISTRTSCAIEWSYRGMPTSPLGLIRLSNRKFLGDSLTIGTSESEVGFDSSVLTNR